MMVWKKIKTLLFTGLLILIFFVSGCTKNEEIKENNFDLDCNEYKNGDKWVNDCSSCVCEKGEITCSIRNCTENLNDVNKENNFQEFISDIKFNRNLNEYEKDWLGYLEIKYPNSKIYHIGTNEINCENCYELNYKKDREIIKIKVLDNKKESEKVVSEIATDIKDEEVCKLFQGDWNECPKVCETDEEACITMCGLPVCQFDYNTIVFREVGEKCGDINYGDCKYGLKCFFESQEDAFGICQ